MIPRNKSGNQTRKYFTRPLKLLETLNLSIEQIAFSAQAAQDFQFKVPASYVDKIHKGDPDDPLLRQIFPLQLETELSSAYSHDPLQEADSLSQPGLLQKYHGRALLLVTSVCAINCRYCFRRHYPYKDKGHVWKQLKANIDYLKEDTSVTEVILSGGDPLTLSDSRLAELFDRLEHIPHIKRLRIHSRIPMVDPERISEYFLKILQSSRLKIIMVLHINHAQEIGLDNQASIAKLHRHGILLFNQSVLLKGVNNSVDILVKLCETLIAHNIIPYYLHSLDKVQGSSHFEVSEKATNTLYQKLRESLPGYMLPRLVREIAGEKSKTPITIPL